MIPEEEVWHIRECETWICVSGKYREEINENPTPFPSWEIGNFSCEVVKQLTKQSNFISCGAKAVV